MSNTDRNPGGESQVVPTVLSPSTVGIRWAAFVGASASSWTALLVSLAAGRTAPTTLSRWWLLSFLGSTAALLAWGFLFGLLLRKLSPGRRCPLASWGSASPAPLLLSTPFLAAIYLSDEAFHFLVANPIPRVLALGTPLLGMLAWQEVTLLFAIPLRNGPLSWLQRQHSAPWLVFGAFAALYVFTAGGHLYSPDENNMYLVTQNLAERGSIDIPRDEYAIAAGRAPFAHSRYGLVPSLLALPPYWASRLLGWEAEPPSSAFPIPNAAEPLIDLLVGPLSAAATCALLYCVARQLGFRAATSLALVAAYGLATSAWVYSKTFFSQPPAALLLMAALYLLLRARVSRRRDYTLAGLCLGLAVGSRVEMALLSAPLAVLLLDRLRRDPRGESRLLAALAVPLVATIAVTVAWYNHAKTGSILQAGYGAQQSLAGFSAEPYIGLFGTFFSSGFGFFVYNPLALLGVCSLPLLALRRRSEAYLFGGFLLLATLLYGSFGDWFAGFTWANRYLVVFLPYALLPAATLLERPWRNGVGLSLLGGAALLGFAINFPAVLFDFNNGWLDLWDRRANLDLIMWDPHFSPILAHYRLLHDFLYTGAKLDLYIYYKLGVPSLIVLVLLFTCLATLAVRAALAATGSERGLESGAPPVRSPDPSQTVMAEG